MAGISGCSVILDIYIHFLYRLMWFEIIEVQINRCACSSIHVHVLVWKLHVCYMYMYAGAIA